MIHVDERGNKFVTTAEGQNLPLLPTSVNIRLDVAMLDGTIVQAWDAISVERTLAAHWYQKYEEAKTTIADLRAQLQAKG